MVYEETILTNREETVGIAKISDPSHIGYFDVKVLEEWVKELKKNTPIDEDTGSRLVSVSYIIRESFWDKQKVVLCGRPIKDIGGNIGMCVDADRAIVVAAYLIPNLEDV